MAQRRMFSQKIVNSDAFLDMPGDAQLLYFHLGMEADDDGFVNPRKIMRMIGSKEDDIKILVAKRFVIPFDNGVVVIKHWKINNLIRKDFYQETVYLEEKNSLKTKENKAYTENGDKMLTFRSRSIGKDSIGKDRLVEREGDKSPTPSLTTEEFFSNPETTIQKLITKGIPENTVREEINKFISYWTELNKTGKKQRWQDQKYFMVGRRLGTWFSRIKDYGNKNNSTVIRL